MCMYDNEFKTKESKILTKHKYNMTLFNKGAVLAVKCLEDIGIF